MDQKENPKHRPAHFYSYYLVLLPDETPESEQTMQQNKTFNCVDFLSQYQKSFTYKLFFKDGLKIPVSSSYLPEINGQESKLLLLLLCLCYYDLSGVKLLYS